MAGSSIDVTSSIGLCAVIALALVAHAISAWAWGRPHHARLDREAGLPLVGKRPMEAVYSAALPVGRALVQVGVTANAVTVASLAMAGGAAWAFATGHFGVGAVVATLAALADALDGIVARTAKTESVLGRVLDTTVDRYVEALLFVGIAVFVRGDVVLLATSLAALVGAFMVSYASSVLRELGAADAHAPMRRAHRMAYLLAGAALAPFAQLAFRGRGLALELAPLVVALAAIALVGNVSAFRRLLRAGRASDRSSNVVRTPEPIPTPRAEPAPLPPLPPLRAERTSAPPSRPEATPMLARSLPGRAPRT